MRLIRIRSYAAERCRALPSAAGANIYDGLSKWRMWWMLAWNDVRRFPLKTACGVSSNGSVPIAGPKQ